MSAFGLIPRLSKIRRGYRGGGRAYSTARAMVAPVGYEVVKEEEIEEYSAKATIFRHKKTGAEVLSMEKDDDNKVFGVAFRTPVDDSMGIPHILEHSVLCGSRKYPTKSPFIELRKSSLHTFLNAMTFPDRTLYPVASQNDRDFYNLADVYLDSVLHPRAKTDPMVMAQEGWHYEVNGEKELNIKGVVYNEMKGVYSSPSSLHGMLTQRSLFPDVTYKESSGGDPERIPDLTYQKFKEFHDNYYHPSNAKFFFYGNDPVQKRLDFLSNYLDEFDSLPNARELSSVGTQALVSEPYTITQYVPVAKGQEEKQTIASVAWLAGEDKLSELESLAWRLIDHLLTGNTAAKLRKTLTDSGLGSSVIGGGMSTYLKQPYYTIGLKGLEDDKSADKMMSITLDVLNEVVESGFQDEALEAALNRVEFSLREFDTGSTRRGMAFLFGAMSSWNYDQDPVTGFKFEKVLAELKSTLKSNPKYLQELIQTRLLSNKHRVLVISKPSVSLEEEKETKLKERLRAEREKMTEEEIEKVGEIAKTLTQRQQTPDPPEAIKTIPRLTLEDLDKETKNIPTVKETFGGSVIGLTHTLPTNGILYADVTFEISGLDSSLIPLLNLFTRIGSGATGTKDKDRVELRQYIDTHTGGVSCDWETSTSVARREDGLAAVAPPDKTQLFLSMSGKAVKEKLGELFGLFNEMLHDCKLDDKERIVQMLKESKSALESSFVSAGNRYAVGRLSSKNHLPGLIGELTGGLSYYNFVCDTLNEAQTDFTNLQNKLQRIKDAIRTVRKSDYVINLTGDQKTLDKARPLVHAYAAELPSANEGVESLSEQVQSSGVLSLATDLKKATPTDEGVQIPTQVNYVAFGGRMYKPGERVPGSTSVISTFLRTGYLWDKIRVIGGAYGAGFSINARMGTYAFSSYRDPNVVKTVENYKKVAEFLIDADIPQAEVERAIIGTISTLDSPQTPYGKGMTGLSRHMTGYTKEDAQRWRDEVLATSVEDFREFGRRLKSALENESSSPSVAAFGSKSALEQAQKEGMKIQLMDAFGS